MRKRVFQASQQKMCRRRWGWVRAGLLAALSIVAAAPVWADEVKAPELPHMELSPVLITPSAVGDIEYRAGRGLKIGDTGLTLGGFSTIAMSRFEGDRARFRLDDLDLFLFFDPTAYLHVFADLAFDQLLELDDGGHEDSASAEASVERLYGDLSINDRLNVRFGKFLTPVGRWNQVPAEPLVWTTSRPLVTARPFDEHVSGAALWGGAFPPGGSLTYTVYGQFLDAFASGSRGSNDAFDPNDKRSPADNSAGARVDYAALKRWSVGASYFTFSRYGAWNHLGGFDGLWQGERWEVSGEFLAGRGDPDSHRIVGLYIQPVVQLADGVHAVGRYEYYDSGAHDPPLHLVDLGVAWRPVPFLIVKADYLIANRSSTFDPPGIYASVSLLF